MSEVRKRIAMWPLALMSEFRSGGLKCSDIARINSFG